MARRPVKYRHPVAVELEDLEQLIGSQLSQSEKDIRNEIQELHKVLDWLRNTWAMNDLWALAEAGYVSKKAVKRYYRIKQFETGKRQYI